MTARKKIDWRVAFARLETEASIAADVLHALELRLHRMPGEPLTRELEEDVRIANSRLGLCLAGLRRESRESVVRRLARPGKKQ